MGRHLLFLLLVTLSGFHLGTSKKLIKENDAIIDDASLMKDVTGDVAEEKEDDDELKRDAAAADDDIDDGQDLSDNLIDLELSDPLDVLLRGWHRPKYLRYRKFKRQNRACTRWYRGWWTADCSGEDQVKVFYSGWTSRWCCVRAKRSKTCEGNGGECKLRSACLPDGYIKPGCTGKLVCCADNP